MQWHFHVLCASRIFVFTTPNINLIETLKHFWCGSSRALITVFMAQFLSPSNGALMHWLKTFLLCNSSPYGDIWPGCETYITQSAHMHLLFIVSRHTSRLTCHSTVRSGWGSVDDDMHKLRRDNVPPELHIQINIQVKWKLKDSWISISWTGRPIKLSMSTEPNENYSNYSVLGMEFLNTDEYVLTFWNAYDMRVHPRNLTCGSES